MYKIFNSIFFTVVTLLASAQSSSDDPLQAKVITLENGLTVMLTENHNLPQIFGVIAVKAGGKNDPKNATGMAHYLEHMLFKGTEEMGTWDYAKEKIHLDKIELLYEELGKTTDAAQRDTIQKRINEQAILAGKYAIPNEMDRMLSEIGGTNVNAFTTEDFTAYHNEFPANKLEQWLQIYDHRFEKPVFRLFQSELETVYEEKNRAMDSPFSEVFDQFNKNFWKNHPYGQQPIIGHTEHLKNPSLQQMYSYFDTYYVANNMVLALSGDFDTDEAIEMIEKYFSDWRTGEIPVFPKFDEKEFNGNEIVEIKATPIKALIRGYRSPKNNHPDQKKMQIANYLLSNGEGSGLLDMLVTSGKISYSGILPFEYNDYSATVVLAIPKIIGQSFKEAEALVNQQLDILKQGKFEAGFFEGAKISMIKDFERQLENNESRALLMVNAFTSNINWKNYLANFNTLKQIKKEDIVEVANKYFGANYLSLYSKMGSPKKDKLNKPKFEAVIPEDGKTSVFSEYWHSTPSEELTARFVDFENDIQRKKIGQFTELRQVNNPFNQIFNLNFSWGIGTDHDSLLYYLPSYLNKLGTQNKSAEEFKKALFEVGASMDFYASDNSFNLRLEGIDSKLDESLNLVLDFLSNYKNDQAAISNIADDIKSERKLNNKDLNNQLNAIQQYALYGNKSKFLRELSSKEIKEIKFESLTKSFQNSITYGLKINYTGKLGIADLEKSLNPILTKYAPGKERMKPVYLARKGFESNKVYFLNNKKAVQSQINFLIEGEALDLSIAGDKAAFNHYFGNDMSSLVFQEIREFRSLAYSTSANYVLAPRPNENNRFYAYVGCQGDKTPEALEVMNDLIQNMPAKRERAEAIRAYLIADAKTNKPGFRQLIGTVDNWKEMGYTEDPNNALIRYYNDLSFDQIVNFNLKHLKGKTMQLFIVGNSNKFDVSTLKKYGALIELSPKQVMKN